VDVFQQLAQLNEQQIHSSLAIAPPRPTEEQLSQWRGFELHCQRRGVKVRTFPASPALVADFLNTLPDDALEPACDAIQLIHDSVGASNPVATLAVRTILERRLRPVFPRSWDKNDRLVFAGASPELRNVILRRENERDTALRRAQNQLAQERKKLPTTTEKAENEQK
jgi:hypothetical protein